MSSSLVSNPELWHRDGPEHCPATAWDAASALPALSPRPSACTERELWREGLPHRPHPSCVLQALAMVSGLHTLIPASVPLGITWLCADGTCTGRAGVCQRHWENVENDRRQRASAAGSEGSGL